MHVDAFRRTRFGRLVVVCLMGSLLTACVNPLARPVATATPTVALATPTGRPVEPTKTPTTSSETPTPSGPRLRAWTNIEAVEWLREAQRSYFVGTGGYGDVSVEAEALLAAEVAGRYAEPGTLVQARLAWEFVLSRIESDENGYGASDAVRRDIGRSFELSLAASHSTTLDDALRTLAWDFGLTMGKPQPVWEKDDGSAWVVGMQAANRIVAVVWLQHDSDGPWMARLLEQPLPFTSDVPTILTADVAGGANVDILIAKTRLPYDSPPCDEAATIVVDPVDAASLSSAQRVIVDPGTDPAICGSWRIGFGPTQDDQAELIYSIDVFIADECDTLKEERAYRWSGGAFSGDSEHSGVTLPPEGSACRVLWAVQQGRSDPAAFHVIEAALAEWPDQLDTIIGPDARDYLRFELAMRDVARGLPEHADHELAALINQSGGGAESLAVKVARVYRDAETNGLWSPCVAAQQLLTDETPLDLWNYGYDSAVPVLREAFGFALPTWTTAPDLACTGPSIKSNPIAVSFDDETAFADWLNTQGLTLTLSKRVDFDGDGQLDWLIVNPTLDSGFFEWHVFLQRDGQLTHVLQSSIESDVIDSIDVKPIAITDAMNGWLITGTGSMSVARITPTAKVLFLQCDCSPIQHIGAGELTLDSGESYRYDAGKDLFLPMTTDAVEEPSIESDLTTAAAMLYFDKDVAKAERLIRSTLERIGDVPDDSYWHDLRSRALYLEASALEESNPAKAVATYQTLGQDYADTLAGWLANRKLTP